MNKKSFLKICLIVGITIFITNDIMYYRGKFDQTFWEHIIIAVAIFITTVNTLFLYWRE